MNKNGQSIQQTYPIRELKALQVPDLTADVAKNLENLLSNLPGIEAFNITAENQKLYIAFDEHLLPLKRLADVMAQAGCPLRNMRAVLIQ